MSFINDTFFGGAERDAARRQASALGRAQDFIRTGATGATGELRGAFGGAEDLITQAINEALGTQRTGIQDIMSTLRGGTGEAINTLRGSEQGGINALLSGLTSAQGQLSPFAEGGQSAFRQQLALSGSLGPEAQQQAFQNFTSSPGQDFLRQQGERSITRQAASTGGVGGGELLADLQRFGTGLAQQDYQNQFNRLSELAGRGQTAASQLAQAGLGTGTNIADIIGRTGAGVSGLQSNLATQLANALGTSTQNISNLLTGRGTQLANLRTGLGTRLADLLTGQATNLANLEQGIGAAQAQGILGGTSALRGTLGDLFNLGQDSSGNFDLGTLLGAFGF